jgi:hypothetical protein
MVQESTIMPENKTKATDQSVDEFLHKVENEKKREDSYKLIEMMREVTGEEPKMWGPSMVGFGKYHYKYTSGREGDAFVTGFSPRKGAMTLYILAGFEEEDDLLSKLGKFTTGKSCLYVKRLSDIDQDVLKQLVAKSVQHTKETYPD